MMKKREFPAAKRVLVPELTDTVQDKTRIRRLLCSKNTLYDAGSRAGRNEGAVASPAISEMRVRMTGSRRDSDAQ